MFLKQKIKNKKNTNFKKGVSLIEALVLIFVFSVSSLAFYSVFSVGVQYITNSKNKVIAVSLVNKRMELLRNISYDDAAIIGGIPNGNIDPDEYVTVGDKTFHLITDIRYHDDADDGIFGGSPNDTVPNDYKMASVTAYWGAESDKEKATLSSRFVPAGVETTAGGGTLSLNAIDFSGSPVPNVSVNVFNDQVSPTVDYNTQTDANGNLLLQGVPTDTDQNYQLTFSKSSYETVITYSPIAAGFIPEYTHIAIIEGALNEKTMRIDLLSDLSIESIDSFGDDVGDADFDLIGGRRLDDGTVPPGEYNYNDSHSTDSNGDFSVDDISPGEYTISIAGDTSTDYEFWKVNPGTDSDSEIFNLSPGVDLTTQLILMDKLVDSVFVKVTDSVNNAPIEGATVQLKNEILGYDVELSSDKYGNVYFPETLSTPLQNGQSYELNISATDYQNNTTDVIVNNLVISDVNLIAT